MEQQPMPKMPKTMQDALQDKIRPYHNALSFKCGVVEAWEYLAPELAAKDLDIECLKQEKDICERGAKQLYEGIVDMRKERDVYKKALEDIAINLYPAPISLAKKALDKYSSPIKDKNNG